MRSENLRGAGLMLVAVGAFAFMDASLKVLSPHYPPLQISALRGLSALPLVLTWIALSGGFGQLLRVRFPLHLLRGALGIASLVFFTYGLRDLPLSETYSIFFVAPLLITIFAALILKEQIGRGRWIAIAVGFGGVLVVLRPTGASAITLGGLAILATAVTYALSAITTRVLSSTDSSQSMVFWVMFMVAVGSIALGFREWKPIQREHWTAIGAMAVTGSIGQWGITEAFRRGQASFIAPLEYTALVWGVLLDLVIWGTLPGVMTYVGAAIIIASGVFLLRQEKVHAEAEHP